MPNQYWQDVAGTIPAQAGDPIALVTQDEGPQLVQPHVSCRPVMRDGVPYFEQGTDECLLEVPKGFDGIDDWMPLDTRK